MNCSQPSLKSSEMHQSTYDMKSLFKSSYLKLDKLGYTSGKMQSFMYHNSQMDKDKSLSKQAADSANIPIK